MRSKMIPMVLLMLIGAGPQHLPGELPVVERVIQVKTPWNDPSFSDYLRENAASILKDAEAKVPGLRPNVAVDWSKLPTLSFERLRTTDNATEIRLTLQASMISSPEISDAQAQSLADAVVDVLRERMKDQWQSNIDATKKSIDELTPQVKKEQDSLADMQKRINSLHDELRKTIGQTELSSADINSQENGLQVERQKLDLEAAGLKARRDAIADAIAKQSTATANTPLAEALEKEARVREQIAQQAKARYEKGLCSELDVSNAEADAARAKARAIEAESAGQIGPAILPELNRQLVMTTIDQRQKEAELAAASARITALSDALAKSRELAKLDASEANTSQALARDKENLENQTRWLKETEQKPPTVTVTVK